MVGRTRQLGSGPPAHHPRDSHRDGSVVGVVLDVVGVGVVVVPPERGAVRPVGQATPFVAPALATLLHRPAVADTVTVMLTPIVVVVVSVVDVPVTVLGGGTPSPSGRLDSTVYCPAPSTAFQLTGIVAVVTSPLVAQVIAPMVTPVGALIWPARAVAVPAFVDSHAAVATPPPASSSVATTPARTARPGRLRRW